MNKILVIALKDLRLISRDKLGMFFILAFPIAMAVFFGSMMKVSSGGKSTAIEIAVVDEDQTDGSRAFIDALRENESLKISLLERKEATDRVRRGQLVGMIAIPEGYGESSRRFWEPGNKLEIGLDPSRGAEAGMLQGMIMQVAGKQLFTQFQDPTQMRTWLDDARAQVADDANMPAALRPIVSSLFGELDRYAEQLEAIDEEQNEAADDAEGDGAPSGAGNDFQFVEIEQVDITRNPSNSVASRLTTKWDISFPQGMMWGVLGCSAGFAVSLVRERTLGTMIRLDVAPITKATVLSGKAFACFLSVLFVVGVLVGLGVFLGMRPANYPHLVMAAVSIASCFVGIMVLFSTIGRTEEAASGACWGVNTLMAMFGGGMVPLAFMPSFMRTLSHASPVKWGVLALEGAIWRDFSTVEMLQPCGILIAIGTVALVLGVVVLSRSSR